VLIPAEIDAVVVRVVRLLDPDQVVVFGSYAKGLATSASDLDLLVIKPTQLPMASRRRALEPLRAGGLVAVDLFVYTPEEVEEYRDDPANFICSALTYGTTLFRRHASAPGV
jgi:predicted nucleotidyltransferase